MLAAIFPRLNQMYHKTGYYALDIRGVASIEYLYHRIYKDKTLEAHVSQESKLLLEQKETPTISQKYGSIWGGKFIRKFAGFFIRGSYELYLLFGILGLALILYRKKWNCKYFILIMLVTVNAAIFYITAHTNFRYYLLNIMLLMPFTLEGFFKIISKVHNYSIGRNMLPYILEVVFVIQIFFGLNNVWDRDTIYWEKMGDYINDNKEAFASKDKQQSLTVCISGVDLAQVCQFSGFMRLT